MNALEQLQAQRNRLRLDLLVVDGQIDELIQAKQKNAIPLNTETLLAWIDAKVVENPIITSNANLNDGPMTEPNSRINELHFLLRDIYCRDLSDYDKGDLISECLGYIMGGVDKPVLQATEAELIHALMDEEEGLLLNGYDITTIEELQNEFGDC